MHKPIILLILLLMFVCCQEYTERNDIANELRDNTFDIISTPAKDTLIIEFNDSTYSVLQNSSRNLPCRITSFENNDFLVLDGRSMVIKKHGKNSFYGLLLAEKDYGIRLEKRKPKWSKELLEGVWIEEQYLNSEPINIPPPPPPPNANEMDYEFPPCYEITEESIYSHFYYKKAQPKINVSIAGEIIHMQLKSKMDIEETEWRVKSLIDSVMIIHRTIEYPHGSNVHMETKTNLKLLSER